MAKSFRDSRKPRGGRRDGGRDERRGDGGRDRDDRRGGRNDR